MLERLLQARFRRRAAHAAAAALLGVGGIATRASETVEFLSPRPHSMAVGPTRIEVRVEPPSGTRVTRVEIGFDDHLLTTLSEPPWTTSWDARDGSLPHELFAVVYLSDGSSRRATVRTSPLKIDAVERVDLVYLYLVVRDTEGRHVLGLAKSDFTVFEDGRKQEIEVFTEEPKRLAVGVVLDASSTMEGRKLAAARAAAKDFLGVLRSGDRGFVIAFTEDVRMLQEMTAETELLVSAIGRVEAGGGTAMNDAVWTAASRLCDQDARRVIVVLSDGRDEAADGLAPGSVHSLEQTLTHVLRCDAMVFAIGFGSDLDRKDHRSGDTHAEILERLGRSTGGRAVFQKNPAALKRSFESIAEDLRRQYALGYTSDNETLDGGWREIRVTPTRTDLEIHTRSGYFAGRHDDALSAR